MENVLFEVASKIMVYGFKRTAQDVIEFVFNISECGLYIFFLSEPFVWNLLRGIAMSF